VPFFCKTALTVLPEGTRVEAYSFDISLGGVGLNAPASCPSGCLVRVSFFLKNPAGEHVEQVLGRVAHVRADESGTRIGIEFQESVGESTHPELTRRLQGL
jgi:c-di-GMP-binding flagellar brake protein YcgR